MQKLIPDNPRVLIQGITGKEGRRALSGMRAYGTNVVAGVTPGKGGEQIDGVLVFNTVKEAIDVAGPVNMIVQFVPPLLALQATEEALAAGVPYLLVGAEKVPVHDALCMIAQAKETNAVLIGPGSVGMIVPHKQIKIGMIGGDTPTRAFTPGNIAILSKSGGMISEIAIHLKQHGLGASLACGLGGERVSGSDFADLLTLLEQDERTHASVIFGEIGGNAEERVAAALHAGHITKPVVAFVAGDFVSQLAIEAPFGHTGAILEKNKHDAGEKRALLKDAGALVAERFDDIAALLASALK